MRMKMVCDDRTLREVANEFLALKKAQKIRKRTLSDHKKYMSSRSIGVDALIADSFASNSAIPFLRSF